MTAAVFILGAVLFAYLAYRGVTTGRVTFRISSFERAREPAMFWIAVGLNAFVAVAAAYNGFIALLKGH